MKNLSASVLVFPGLFARIAHAHIRNYGRCTESGKFSKDGIDIHILRD